VTRRFAIPNLIGLLVLAGALVAAGAGSAGANVGVLALGNTGTWSSPVVPPGADPLAIGVHSIVLHTGKVLVFGQNIVTKAKSARAYVYDPATGNATEDDPPAGANIECAGAVPLADGRVLVVGGHGANLTGVPYIYLFDPVDLSWTRQPDSPLGRYYPTVVRLPDGNVLILGGKASDGTYNQTVELYVPPVAPSNVGTLSVVGPLRDTQMYSRPWVMPDGIVLDALPSKMQTVTPGTWSWANLAKPSAGTNGMTGALLPGSPAGSTRILLGGGGKTTVRVFDYATPSAGWHSVASLPNVRAHMSPVLLPDGSLLGVGGNTSGQFVGPELSALDYSPRANTWTTWASQQMRRGYHSTAVLLPDGRVLSAGDTGSGGGNATVEVFSPPYLSAGPRPVIDAAPTEITHGGTFAITTTSTSSTAVLMSPGAATHTVDMNGRYIALAVTPTTDGLSIVAPSGNVAVSGWYMLFVVDPTGVPSVASWVHISG
jgi:galactose oxidase